MSQVTVLTGGSTAEREVALSGATQVVQALRRLGYVVSVVDTVEGPLSPEDEARYLISQVGTEPPPIEKLEGWAEQEKQTAATDLAVVRNADLVFLLLHGNQGEGGDVQAALELRDVRYTGSDSTGSANAMDKIRAKELTGAAGVPTLAWCRWPCSDAEVGKLGMPLIVKPSKVGSTLGLTLLRERDELDRAIEVAARYDDEVLLEAFAVGREFTVGVLGDEALAVGEILPEHTIFDYECKYTPGMCREVFPAEITRDAARTLQQLALLAHRSLGLRHFSRVDFKLDSEGTPMFLEANTLPGFTRTSLLPQSAAAAGIPFDQLCDRICRLALSPGTAEQTE